MTVVIGLKTKSSIIFGSDGYALYQDEANGPVYKVDTYNKIYSINDSQYLLGCAGSHQIGFEICNVFNNGKNDRLSENEFLDYLGDQIKALNNNNEGKHTSVILGYSKEKAPKIILFQKDGSYSEHQNIVALGSGADLAMDYLSARYCIDWQIEDAIKNMVNAIFDSSRVPTVNFLPMISILSRDRLLNLSSVTIDMYNNFRKHLRQRLITKTKCYYSN